MRQKSILLIEDEPRLQDIFSTVLEAEGYYIIKAKSCEEGIKKHKENYDRIYLVILGMTLSSFTRSNSMEFLEYLHKTKLSSKTIALESGGYTSVEKNVILSFAEDFKDHGGYLDFAKKPISTEDFINKVKKVIGTTKKSDLIKQFIEKIDPNHQLKEEERSYLYNETQPRLELQESSIEDIIINNLGFTSLSVFEFGDKAIKVDKKTRLQKELEVYSLELKDFSNFMAKVKAEDLICSDSILGGILIMPNLKKYEQGLIKANRIRSPLIPEFTKHGFAYNLFLMGLFHKEATKHIDGFEQILYKGVHEIPHYEECSIPNVNVSGEGLKRFEETDINAKKVISIIKEYRAIQKAEARTVIHGDWKPENMVNGHMVDYAMVGIGFEVDELAFYLSNYRFNTELPQFHRVIDQYIQIRSKHDLEFRLKCEDGYRTLMHQLADSAFLSQLILRESVMNKRNMMDNAKFEQRQNYQHMIDEVLKEGEFI